MSTSRPFAYNPSKIFISGTTQIGDLAIGVNQLNYDTNPGGLQWWNGADEDLGYIICEPVPDGNQPTPIGNIGTVRFYRSKTKTDIDFINLVNSRYNQNFNLGSEAVIWLNSNGYWTSYTQISNFSSDSDLYSTDTELFSADME